MAIFTNLIIADVVIITLIEDKREDMKDFLAFHGYSSNFNFKILCNTLIDFGYEVDRADERNVENFNYLDGYKYIIMCWHSDLKHYDYIRKLIKKKYAHVPIILYDDTDWNVKTMKFHEKPKMVFKRELSVKTKKIKHVPYYSMPKIVEDNYHPEVEKIYDVSFIGSVTSKYRDILYDKLDHIKKDNWFISKNKYPYDDYIRILNQSKIGLSTFGNGYDTIRYWEVISCKTALLSPKIPLDIVDDLTEKEMLCFDADASDLEEKINYLLENDRWKIYAENGYKAFQKRHSNIKRTEYFLTKMKECDEPTLIRCVDPYNVISRFFNRVLG